MTAIKKNYVIYLRLYQASGRARIQAYISGYNFQNFTTVSQRKKERKSLSLYLGRCWHDKGFSFSIVGKGGYVLTSSLEKGKFYFSIKQNRGSIGKSGLILNPC